MEYGVKFKKSYRKKKLDSDPVFGYKYLQTKIKSYDNKITKNYHGKATKEGIKCVCLSVISIDVLEECKYKIKEKQMKSIIKDNQESSFDGDSEEEKNSE